MFVINYILLWLLLRHLETIEICFLEELSKVHYTGDCFVFC